MAHARSQESHYSNSTYVHDSTLEEILIYLADETLSDQEINEYLEVLEEQYPDVYQMLVAEGLLRINQFGIHTLLVRCRVACGTFDVEGDFPVFGEVDFRVEVCGVSCDFKPDDRPSSSSSSSSSSSGGGGTGGGGTGGGGIPGLPGHAGTGIESIDWDQYKRDGCGGIC